MTITKVKSWKTTTGVGTSKNLIVVYDSGVQFSFPETDEDKEKNEVVWNEIQAWVSAGNTIEIIDSSDSDWDQVRNKRDLLLKDSDWAMTTGATIDQAQWSAYREKLRDIPQTYKDKETSEIVWPTIPSSKGPNS